MSTRWQIAAKLSDGQFACIYVHCDGYPSYALNVLSTHYTDQEKIDELISRGDCLSIGPDIESCETFRSRGDDWQDVAPSYGESLTDAAENHLHGDEEYRYGWDGNAWTMLDFGP